MIGVFFSRNNPCDVTRAVFLDILLDLTLYDYLEGKGNNN